MNDNNKSSQDVEFDFNNPKATERIVDPSMIRTADPVKMNAMKMAVIGVFVLGSLGYWMFAGSSKKSAPPTPSSPVQTLQHNQADLETPVDPAEAYPEGSSSEAPTSTEQYFSDELKAESPALVEDSKQPAPEKNMPKADPEATPSSQKVLEAEEKVEVPAKVTPAVPANKEAVVSEPVPATTAAPVAAGSISAEERPVKDTRVDYDDLAQKIASLQEEFQKALADHAQKSDAIQKSFTEGFKKYAAATMQRLDQISKDQAALSQSLQSLSDSSRSSEDQIQRIDKFVRAEMSVFSEDSAGITLAPVAPKYVVHAIIPGRAWLRDPQQKITSIVEGQEIEGYGKVLTIDPKQGTVILSSGQVLRY